METANGILSLFLPLVIALVKQSGFDDRANHAIALAIYLAWAVVATVVINGGFEITQFLATFGTTLVAGTVAYQMIWRAFGIDDKLTDVTSVQKPPVEDVVIAG